MRKNKIQKTGGIWKKAVVVSAVLAIAAGCAFLFVKVREAFLRQCVVTDVRRQVRVTTGQTVKESVVIELFGIKKGANLAEIDFAKKREATLAKHPAIRAITVRRHLPDKVDITVEERVPVAKVNETGANRQGRMVPSGRVVDSEGVVFMRRKGTEALPVICERSGNATKPGKRLEGMARAALDLVSLAREAPYSDLGIMRVDATSRDYLLAILGDYSPAKIAWEGMETPATPASRKAMERQLKHLRDSVMSGVAPAGTRPVVWNATEPNRVFADTKEPIL